MLTTAEANCILDIICKDISSKVNKWEDSNRSIRNAIYIDEVLDRLIVAYLRNGFDTDISSFRIVSITAINKDNRIVYNVRYSSNDFNDVAQYAMAYNVKERMLSNPDNKQRIIYEG